LEVLAVVTSHLWLAQQLVDPASDSQGVWQAFKPPWELVLLLLQREVGLLRYLLGVSRPKLQTQRWPTWPMK
jgi:hypothetical protein